MYLWNVTQNMLDIDLELFWEPHFQRHLANSLHPTHFGIRRDELEGLLDLRGRRAAAHIQEVGRVAAMQLDDVHGGHGQARPVHQAPDLAVQPDVVEVRLGRLHVPPVLLTLVPLGEQRPLPERRVVVYVDLAVHAHHLPVGGLRERVDLQENAVALPEQPVSERKNNLIN